MMTRILKTTSALAICLLVQQPVNAGVWDSVKNVGSAVGGAVSDVSSIPVDAVKEGGKVLRKTGVSVVAPGASIAYDVARGERPDRAIRKVVSDRVTVVTSPLKIGTTASTRANGVVGNAVGGVLGDRAGKIFRDATSINNLGPRVVVATADSASETIRSGKISNLNPINIVAASDIKRARDLYWDSASPIPHEIQKYMPVELSRYAGSARYLLASNLGAINIPNVATRSRNGIVMDDLIFVTSLQPYEKQQENLYFWTHEIYHVKQYKEMGLHGFTTQFLDHETNKQLGLTSGLNPIEEEADNFACSHYPVSTINTYINDCGSR